MHVGLLLVRAGGMLCDWVEAEKSGQNFPEQHTGSATHKTGGATHPSRWNYKGHVST